MLSTNKVLNPCGVSKCPVLSWLQLKTPHDSVTVSDLVQQQGAAGSCGLVGMGGILGILSVCVGGCVATECLLCRCWFDPDRRRTPTTLTQVFYTVRLYICVALCLFDIISVRFCIKMCQNHI